MNIYYLLGGLLAVYLISSVMNGALHDSTAELPGDVRDRVFRGEARMAWLWRIVEFAGFALIVLGILPIKIPLPTAHPKLLALVSGLVLFCISNTASAWAANAVYRREASGTKSSRAALRAAIVVTLAEIALLSVVFWLVSYRLNWFSTAKSGAQPSEVEPAEEDTGVWIDESDALKQLSSLPPEYAKDPEYVKGLAESGRLRTKVVGGKKKYSLEDVEILKKRKNDIIP